jgi:hypothetical protein
MNSSSAVSRLNSPPIRAAALGQVGEGNFPSWLSVVI